MEVKDFNKGQRVFVLSMYEGRNREPEITPRAVDKVGTKYVTICNGHRYEAREYFEFGLVEAADCGERTFLCQSETDAKKYIEKCGLVLWLRNLNLDGRGSKYSLSQLREVKKIFD